MHTDKLPGKTGLTKLELHGEEVIEKEVKSCGKCCPSGRVYLPVAWVGRRVKIVRLD